MSEKKGIKAFDIKCTSFTTEGYSQLKGIGPLHNTVSQNLTLSVMKMHKKRSTI